MKRAKCEACGHDITPVVREAVTAASRKLGRKGGLARAAKLSPAQKSAIGKAGAKARWGA